ncbi:hypothetical protein F0C76_18400 [Escherichia coli]|nr:hypothetical protein [Escherichia coli]EEQ1746955.1 hypothetical protein [Escherichia coli]EEU9303426.1 hypothetical protein [Escherichia coli]EEU9308182.1 hypothetical protein [Escherichia coli]EEU9312822.1 hypothetical protein [Escherichia coli]
MLKNVQLRYGVLKKLCMQQVNVFACVEDVRSGCVRSGLVRIHSIYATALKPPREAGGRGGESTARWRWC